MKELNNFSTRTCRSPKVSSYGTPTEPITLEQAANRFSRVAYSKEDHDWIDVRLLSLPNPSMQQRRIDYEALSRSVDHYLAPLERLQPASHAAFYQGDAPRMVLLERVWTDEQLGMKSLWCLCLNVNGRLLQVSVGDGIDGYCERLKLDVWQSLPQEISRSWLWRITDWKVPLELPEFPMVCRQMVGGTISQGLDDICLSFGLGRKAANDHVHTLISEYPDIAPLRRGGRVNLRCFLDTRPVGVQGPVGDQLFVRSRMRDGVVYRVRNGDVENLSILEEAAHAIDLYHEHLLLKKSGEFDFSPWARPA